MTAAKRVTKVRSVNCILTDLDVSAGDGQRYFSDCWVVGKEKDSYK